MTDPKLIKETHFPGLKLLHRGKVRDVYIVDDLTLLLVATDRISAFDCVIPNAIPRKGEVLTKLSTFWFKNLSEIGNHHLITSAFDEMPSVVRQFDDFRDRSMLVKRTKVIPFECVVRGYLSGSGWKDYLQSGEICGHKLPEGLKESDQLPQPIFTPASKAAVGHDENVSESFMIGEIGAELTGILRDWSLRLYEEAFQCAVSRGIIIADTKFEFGIDENGDVLLIDEVLTPDSSRFWDLEKYAPGKSQASFDKQFVRDYLETLDWDKTSPAPELPEMIVSATAERYFEAFRRLTNKDI